MTQTYIRNRLKKAPWIFGLLLAVIPLIWLWFNYPIMYDSQLVAGRVTRTDIEQRDVYMRTGGNGTARASCYRLLVSFDFDVDREKRVSTASVKSCDLLALKQRAEQLRAAEASVIYSHSRPASVFLVSTVSKTDLKLAAGLVVGFFFLGTLIAGRKLGCYSANFLNISVSEIRFRHAMGCIALIIFYAWLVST
jgi:hypothetical protein